MMNDNFSAGDYLVSESLSTSTAQRLLKAEKRTTSFQITLTSDAKVEAICELTGLTRNKVIDYLLQSGIEMYESQILDSGDPDLHTQYRELVASAKEKNNK